MKLFSSLAFAPVLGAALLLTLCPLAARARNAEIGRALNQDLEAIPAGMAPLTPGQKQALFDDLARLFRRNNSVPTATLNYVVEQLAQAKAGGVFAEGDVSFITQRLLSILNGSTKANQRRLAALRLVLERAQVQPALVDHLLAGLQALPKSFFFNSDGSNRTIELPAIAADRKGYKHASGNASLSRTLGPLFDDGSGVTDPAHVFQDLVLSLSQAPLGRYHVLATTRANAQPVELGTLRVRQGGLLVNTPLFTDETDVASAFGAGPDDAVVGNLPPEAISPLPVGPARTGTAIFSNGAGGKRLPAGFDVADVASITVTDDAGTVQFAGDFSNQVTTSTSRFLNLHLDATNVAPTAAGIVSLTVFNSAEFHNRNFQFNAIGFPANATLTLSADGVVIGPVTTGPTGKLFIKDENSYLPQPRSAAEKVNILPDTVDLSAAKSFALSDEQGNVLVKAGF